MARDGGRRRRYRTHGPEDGLRGPTLTATGGWAASQLTEDDNEIDATSPTSDAGESVIRPPPRGVPAPRDQRIPARQRLPVPFIWLGRDRWSAGSVAYAWSHPCWYVLGICRLSDLCFAEPRTGDHTHSRLVLQSTESMLWLGVQFLTAGCIILLGHPNRQGDGASCIVCVSRSISSTTSTSKIRNKLVHQAGLLARIRRRFAHHRAAKAMPPRPKPRRRMPSVPRRRRRSCIYCIHMLLVIAIHTHIIVLNSAHLHCCTVHQVDHLTCLLLFVEHLVFLHGHVVVKIAQVRYSYY